MRAVDTVIEIDTPEHLAFQVRLAGPARRLFAWAIDLFARVLILAAVGLLLLLFVPSFESVTEAIGEGGGAVAGYGVFLLALFVVEWGYFFGFEVATGGRSPGKMLLSLRVVRQDGLPVTWRESLTRTLLRGIDLDLNLLALFGVPPVGGLVAALDPKFRRLGDLAAGTIVVVEEKPNPLATCALVPDDEVVARLPSALPLGREDLEAIELFVHREHMSPARQRELADIVAPLYARRLGVEPMADSTKLLASIWAKTESADRKVGR